MAKYRRPVSRDRLIILGAVALCIGMVTISVLILMSGGYQYMWVLAIMVTLCLLVRGQVGLTANQCTGCGHEFAVGVVTDSVRRDGPGGDGGYRYLKCPGCGRRSRLSIHIESGP